MLRRIALVFTAPIWFPLVGCMCFVWSFILLFGALIQWIVTGQGLLDGSWNDTVDKYLKLDCVFKFLFGENVLD